MFSRNLLFALLAVLLVSCKNKGTKPILPYYLSDANGNLREVWIQPDQTRTAFQKLASFTLKDQNDDLISSDQLRAKALVVSFFFGDCNQRCEPGLEAMEKLQSRFENEDILLLTFSIDSRRDSLEVLEEIGAQYNADPDKWLFLAGDDDQVRDLLSVTFKKFVIHPNDLKDINTVYLIDKSGFLRGSYDLSDEVNTENLALDSHLFRN